MLARKNKKGLTIVPVREPNGRLLRTVEDAIEAKAPSEVRRLRDAAVRKMAAPEWGTELGRLYLAGKIGPKLYETGRRWTALARAYAIATGAPPEAPSGAVFALAGRRRPPDPDTPEGQRLAKREAAVMVAAEEALAILTAAGSEKHRAVQKVCEHDQPLSGEREHGNLMIGLGWLAQHWGLLSFTARKS